MGQNTLFALDCNYLEASRIFVGFSDTGEYLERRDVAIVCCGLPVQELNFGFLKRPYEDLGSTTAMVRSYFADRKLPFRLMFRDLDPQCVQKLKSAGWYRKNDLGAGMTLAMPKRFPQYDARCLAQRARQASAG